jgi:protein-arginine kinase activator protein McsA
MAFDPEAARLEVQARIAKRKAKRTTTKSLLDYFTPACEECGEELSDLAVERGYTTCYKCYSTRYDWISP